MAKSNHISIPAHYNIYNGEHNRRNLDIYFTEPESGVNSNTGILLLIPGFGGNSNSKIYQKMRLQFADSYNLIVIQCDYFGSEFMQGTSRVKPDYHLKDLERILSKQDFTQVLNNQDIMNVINVLANYPYTLDVTEILDEKISNFNDMGWMQAMDLLTAVYAIKAILADNKLKFNQNKVIAYGHSHGAYLGYLCNRLAPNEFSLIIDNSAWVKPLYFNHSRFLIHYFGEMALKVKFDYLAKNLQYDKDILDLNNLYRNFENNAIILSYHGIDDDLVNINTKKCFCESVINMTLFPIGEKDLNKGIFKSTNHGLTADFIKHFDDVMNAFSFSKDKKEHKKFEHVIIKHRESEYVVDYSSGLPRLTCNTF
ncbi:DUF2920 family protein [Paucisalibacillus globulus]|uniref:DUF2920 family protein n=1 Tax=Paucisalibacillus globulus TaxID=351095 RepID=UPI00041F09C5|nr:DUF2920 family protein [Paucisalibacillus globulus]